MLCDRRMVPRSNGTQDILHNHGTLNPRPDAGHDGLVHTSDFFDARDLLHVRYEMLRRGAVDGWSVTQATPACGCSRPVFSHARTACAHAGLQGLIPHKRGPKDAHKLSTNGMVYVSHLLPVAPPLSAPPLPQALVEHCGRLVHPRRLVRALARHTKTGGLSRCGPSAPSTRATALKPCVPRAWPARRSQQRAGLYASARACWRGGRLASPSPPQRSPTGGRRRASRRAASPLSCRGWRAWCSHCPRRWAMGREQGTKVTAGPLHRRAYVSSRQSTLRQGFATTASTRRP
jgi:hypothetical protein